MNTQETTKKGFFKKLYDGDFGLPKTYWLFGVLANIVLKGVTILVSASDSILLIGVSLLAIVVYSIIQMIGLWNAASRYTGSKVWAILAKISVVLGVLVILVSIGAML